MAESAAEVVTLGESMARLTGTRIGPLRTTDALSLGIAGAESNLAIGLARLGVGVSWTGRVGDDEFGRLVTTTLRGEGVRTRAIVDADAPTGLLVKGRRTAAVTEVQYYRSGSAGSRLAPDDLDHEGIAAAEVLHLTGITPALSRSAREACFAAVETARTAGTAVSLDLNMRSRLWGPAEAAPVLRDLARLATIVFASDHEARLLADGAEPAALARAIAGLGPSEVVIKLGADGALGSAGDEELRAPVHEVVEVDPVGAGDAFCAGYIRERLLGAPLARRLATAAVCGAYAAGTEGDWEGLPTAAELEAASGHDVRR